MTALKSALTKAGFEPRVYALGAAIQKFKKDGGTVEELIDAAGRVFPSLLGMVHTEYADSGLVTIAHPQQSHSGGHRLVADVSDVGHTARAAATPLLGEGQTINANNGRAHVAPTQQPLEDAAGRHRIADGQEGNARPSSSNRGREGRPPYASGHTSNALPVRDADTKRGLKSISAIQSTIKQGLIELKKTTDGRPWGSVGWHELDGMDRDGAIARLVKRNVNPPRNQFAMLRTFVSNKQFEEIVSAAQKQNDFV